MKRPLQRRAAALTAALVVLAPALTACGGEDEVAASASSGSSTDGGIDGLSVTGEVGQAVEARWDGEIAAPAEPAVTTLVEGDGDEVADGDTVSVYLWLGDASTKQVASDGYSQGTPQAIPFDAQLQEPFKQLLDGATYGSRQALVASAGDVFGDAGPDPSLGVGADDTVVVIADLVEKQPESVQPSSDKVEDAPADSQPRVVEEGGVPTGLDFSGLDEPDPTTPVQRVVLEKGDGRAVKPSDTITINYLGATFDADEPFDESFSGDPLTSPLSGLIQGWSIGLDGVKVGSRVLLQIPPGFGYGAQGSGAIPPNATLWFVIDVEDAAAR